jgi:RND family efflux transporter MFP subunit
LVLQALYNLSDDQADYPLPVDLDAAPAQCSDHLPRSIERTLRVQFIDPVLDRATRSARVRIALPNPGGILKPGMFADARLEIPSASSLVIPKSALIDTGARRVVYVETAPNTFTARDVKTGEASGDRIAVLDGLKEGDRVVAAAAFFVDSQAQLAGGAAIQYSGALDVREKAKEDKP